MPLAPGPAGLKFWTPSVPWLGTYDGWNPADKTASLSISNVDKTVTSTTTGAAGVRSLTPHRLGSVGKFYAEFYIDAAPVKVGFKQGPPTGVGVNNSSIAYESSTGNLLSTTTIIGNVGVGVTGNIISVAADFQTGRFWFCRNNGLWNNSSSDDPATGTGGFDGSAFVGFDWYLWFQSSGTVGSSATVRTELAEFTYSIPSGFTSWMDESAPAVFAADAGTYALTGASAVLTFGHVAAAGSYALTGTIAALTTGLSAGSGNYALTGSDVSFVTGIGNVTLSAAGGSYALTGGAAAFVASSNVTLGATAGSYALSGADAVLARKLICGVGFYTFIEAPVTLAIRATAASGSYVLTGSDAELATELAADYTLVADAGSYAITGSDVSFIIEPVAEVAVDGGGAYYPPQQRLFPVVGRGYGILPQLEGEAHGVVVVVGAGAGTLPGLVGEAAGTVGVVGRSAAQLLVHAAAIGNNGQVGAAVAVLKGLSVASHGAIGTHGSGSGTIMKFEATANGRHDDDEAAVMAFLLAA